MTVSPDQDYAIKRWTHRFGSLPDAYPDKYVMTREFEQSADPLRCKQIRMASVFSKTGLEQSYDSYIFSYPSNATEPVDPAEFTLDYYLIPTPNEAPEDKPKSRWPWWATAGIVCIVLSLVLGFYARYRSQSRTGGA
jgi:hypothetical protein